MPRIAPAVAAVAVRMSSVAPPDSPGPSRPGSLRDSPAARSPVGRRLLTGASWVASWLARPLTSLHLLLGVFGLLTVFGLVMVLSASSVESLSADGSTYSIFTRQLMFCGLGLPLFYLGLRIPPRRWRAWSPWLLVASTGLMVAVLVPGIGVVRNGSRGWIALGSLSFQPAEAAKIALVLWGAHALASRRPVLHLWRHALVPVLPVTVGLLVLLVLQPDLGGAVSLGVVSLALLFYAQAPLKLLAALSAGAVTGAGVLALSAGYRASRVASFLYPDTADPTGAAYQATQALYSLADGGVFGVGLGQGRAKWDYLPNAHNDFIFAIVGEELGFLGAAAVLALFVALAYTGMRIAARVTDPWLRIVTATATTWLVTQAAINIGYVVGLLPVTGLQLPLISSGGTSLVITMFTFGLLANAARHEPEAIATPHRLDQGRFARLLRLSLPHPTASHTGQR